jgi:hypothetical protein
LLDDLFQLRHLLGREARVSDGEKVSL